MRDATTWHVHKESGISNRYIWVVRRDDWGRKHQCYCYGYHAAIQAALELNAGGDYKTVTQRWVVRMPIW